MEEPNEPQPPVQEVTPDPVIPPFDMEAAEKKATAGSEEDQVALGRHLLSLAESGVDEEKNGLAAVTWLVRASKQGNEEATELLARCLEADIGVTPANREDVEWCVETSSLEKSARLAAKTIFRRLNPLHTKEISKEDFLDAISSGDFNSREKKLLERAGKFKNSNFLSENAFVDKVVGHLKGSGGTTLSTLLQKEEGETFQSASIVRKVFYYPGKSLMRIGDSSVEFAAKQGMTWLKSLIPTQQVHMLLVFFLYSVLSLDFFIRIVPLFMFYFALLAMIICTLQMFYGKRKLKDVEALANMLNRFNETVDTDNAVSSFTWHSLTPYIGFFVALGVSLISFSLVDTSWIPCSELCCVALFFAMTCFAALSDKYDHLVLMSIGANFIATLPAIIENFPPIPGVYHLVHLFAGSVITVEIAPEVVVNFGLPSLVYMVVPFLFLKMALQHGGQGMYRVLVPHLVCFFWWQFGVVMFRNSSWLGLVRGSIGWVMLVVLAPLLFILVIIYAVYYVTQIFTVASILKLITTLTLLAIPAALGFWAKKGFQIKGFDHEKSRAGKIMLVVLSVFTVLPIVYFVGPREVDVGGEYITWQQYKQFCSVPQWERTNMADAQIKCGHLTNLMVSWSGTVKKVVVSKVDNGGDSFVNLMPISLGDWLRCTYGQEYPPCDEIQDAGERDLCLLHTSQGRKCHMRAMDYYTFELWVSMPVLENDDGTGPVHDVRIEARNPFRSVLLKLQSGDQVTFRAALHSELGNIWPKLKLYHVECTSCSGRVVSGQLEEEEDKGPYRILLGLRNAIFDTLNFFLYPVLEFGKKVE